MKRIPIDIGDSRLLVLRAGDELVLQRPIMGPDGLIDTLKIAKPGMYSVTFNETAGVKVQQMNNQGAKK